MRACLQGKPAAQRTLFDRFATKMMSVCRRYTPDPAEVQDLHQLGFIRVFERLGQYQGGSLEGWVRRVHVTTCLNAYAQRKRRLAWEQTTTDQDLNTPDGFTEDALAKLSAQHLIDLIATLPPGARIVFNLYAIEGYSHQEIGSMLSIAESTSRVQLVRARQALQKRLATTHPHLMPQRSK